MDDETFKVAELAEFIAAPGSGRARRAAPRRDIAKGKGEIELLLRRIRHWTLTGALVPSGPTHAGTGRHRRYSRGAAYRAAVLNRLADWGLPVTVVKAAGLWLQEQVCANGPAAMWADASEGTGEVCMILTLVSPADRANEQLVQIELKQREKAAEWIAAGGDGIIVNLTELFAPIIA